jgi:hypothetical protein
MTELTSMITTCPGDIADATAAGKMDTWSNVSATLPRTIR